MRRAVSILTGLLIAGSIAGCGQTSSDSGGSEAPISVVNEPVADSVLDDLGSCLIGTWEVDQAGNQALMEAVFAKTVGEIDFTWSGESTVTFEADGTFSSAADIAGTATFDMGVGPMDVSSESTSNQSGTWTTSDGKMTAVVLEEDNKTVTTVNGTATESVSAPGSVSSGAVPATCDGDTAELEIEIPESAAEFVPEGYAVVLHRR